MKIGIVGKGGIGKTTIAALLATTFAEQGRRVLALDTDSNPNLALSLGVDPAAAEGASILPRHAVAGAGDPGMTPATLIEGYGLATPSGVTVVQTMAVTQAGAGCSCSGHATVRSLLGAAIEEEADVTIIDMEAGLEHLSRSGGTLAYADAIVVVMTPSPKSVLTAVRTRALADELGIPLVYGVANMAELPRDAEFFRAAAAEHGITLAGIIPYDDDVRQSDLEGGPLPAGRGQPVRAAVAELAAFLASQDLERRSLVIGRDRIDQRIAELERSG